MVSSFQLILSFIKKELLNILVVPSFRSKKMHYKNGREAKNGDKVVYLSEYGSPIGVVGILYDAVVGNDTCNGRLAVTTSMDVCPNLKNCLHIDDVKVAEINDTSITNLE
jgi:hypothetical protein